MKKIITLSFLSSMLLIAGCAGNPRVGQHGEDLVWIQSIQVTGDDSNKLYLPFQGGIVGTLLLNAAGVVSNKANEGKFHIVYSPDGSRVGRVIFRKPGQVPVICSHKHGPSFPRMKMGASCFHVPDASLLTRQTSRQS